MIDTSETAKTEPLPGGASRWLTAALAGGVVGTVVALVMAGVTAPGAWIYAGGVGLACAVVFGIGSAVLVAVAGVVGRAANPSLGRLIAVLPVVVAFEWVNRDLFDGVWIRSQSWVNVAEWGFRIGGAVAILALPSIFAAVDRARLGWRLLFGVAVMGVAVVAAKLDQQFLAAYPQLKLQFAFLLWFGPSLVLWWWGVGRGATCGRAVGLTVLVAAAAIAGPVWVRRDAIATDRARGVILTKPVPGVIRAIAIVESSLFERLAPVKLPDVDDIAVDLDARYDAKALTAALDVAAPKRRDFNVLMIAIDAMRADHMSCEGYSRPTTPTIDALAKSSAWFRRAVAPVPASSMGYSASMSGLYARVTPAYAKEFNVQFPVPEQFMLAEVMKETGRETMGVTGFHPAVQGAPKFKILEKGFDRFNPDKNVEERTGEEVTASALGMLDRRLAADKPWFMWVHYMEPHAPYHFHVGRDFGRRPIDAYDSEIAEADAQVAKLLERLERAGERDKTIIVVFGDHGEGFGEHSNREHGASLYEHQVRIPLIVHVPGLAPKEIRQWATLADITPTILSILGIESKPPRMGRPLTPLMTNVAVTWPDWAYSERAASASKVPRSWERAVWRGDSKLIWLPHDRTYQFFDLAKDPDESQNAWSMTDMRCLELRAIMRAVDARIDATWGASSTASADEIESIDVRFKRLVGIASTGDAKAADEALDQILAILNSDAILLDPTKQDRLGLPALDAFLAWARPQLRSIDPASPRAQDLVRITMFANRKEDAPLLAAMRERITHGDLRLRLAHWLAFQGNETGRPDLNIAFEAGPIEARITAAAGLAALGDERGRSLMLAALDIEHVGRLREAIFGLAALKDPTPLQLQASTMRSTLSTPWVQGALLDAALAVPDGPDARASLLLLSRSTDPRVAKVAGAALAERLKPDENARRKHVDEVLEGVRSALLYGDGRLAAGFFTDLDAADDPLLGHAWWLGIRTARSIGNPELLAKCADRYLSVAGAGVAPRDRLASLMPEVPKGVTVFKGEPAGDFAVPILDRGRLFTATLKITNTSGVRLGGGECPDAFVLEWRYDRPDGTRSRGQRLVQTRLPAGGLEPGADATLAVPGMFPEKPGDWTPVLLAIRDWAGLREEVILTAPKVTLK